jgi:hypothetical protein
MSKRKTSGSTKEKSCSMFKKEWLPEIIETKITSLKYRQKAKIGDIYSSRN